MYRVCIFVYFCVNLKIGKLIKMAKNLNKKFENRNNDL